jgi:AcrR family transcriptional regulator
MARIDRDDRARAVYDAAIALLARGGYSAITLRELADALGGSMTLVTHYFPTQADLMRGVLDYQLTLFEEELATVATSSDPAEQLREVIEWFLPISDETWNQERARVLLALQGNTEGGWMREYLNRVERQMRGVLRTHLGPLVAPEHLPLATDAVRMVISGIVLSAVEHRSYWTPERQRAVVDALWTTLPWKDGYAAAT